MLFEALHSLARSPHRDYYLAAMLVLLTGPATLFFLWLGYDWYLPGTVFFVYAMLLMGMQAWRGRFRKDQAFWMIAFFILACALLFSLVDSGYVLLAPVAFVPLYLWLVIPLWRRWQWADGHHPLSGDNPLSMRRWALILVLFVMMCAHALAFSLTMRLAGSDNLDFVEETASWGIPLLSQAQYTCLLLKQNYLWRENLPWPGVCRGNPDRVLAQYRAKEDFWSEIVDAGSGPVAPGGDIDLQGFGLKLYLKGESIGLIYDVAPGSLAERNGIRRGDRVVALEGKPADGMGLISLLLGLPLHTEIRRTDGTRKTIAWGEFDQTSYRSPALPEPARILERDGVQIGYLQYRGFKADGIDELVAAFRQLQAAAIRQLIVDLRQNGGGDVRMAQTLGTLIAGERVAERPMARIKYIRDGDTHVQDIPFDRTDKLPTLDLASVVVLTSGHTCSASEMLIFGLGRHMQVVTVGGPTCGKSYTIQPRTYRDKTWLVVNSLVVDATGNAAYPNGISPRCAVTDSGRGDYGSTDDSLLDVALHYLKHGHCGKPQNASH